MAVLRAFQATDMRAELGFGIPVAVDRFSIVIEDAVRTTTFRGDFFFPGFEAVNAPWLVLDELLLDPLLVGGVEGVLLGYEQERFGLRQYEVQGLNEDAFAAFFALFRLDDTQLFQSLVFGGDDVMFGSRQRDVLIGFAGRDQLGGFDGNDSLVGGAGSDTIYGDDGRDVLRGGVGLDWLWGGDDDDRVFGDSGDDRIDGEQGNDVLVGGRGQDTLRGGRGADTFRYVALADSPQGSSRRDFIRDFGDGDDVIDLRAIDAELTRAGGQPFTFIGEARFSGVEGQLRFDPGDRLVQGDTDGDGRADFEIELGGSVVPDAADFLL
jgi:Ca2+-binding RTX toxin-like protein